MKKHLFIFIALGLVCFGMQAKQAHAAVAYVQSATSSKWFGASTSTATDAFVAQNVTAGDLIAGAVVWKSPDTLNTVADSCGNSYVVAATSSALNGWTI